MRRRDFVRAGLCALAAPRAGATSRGPAQDAGPRLLARPGAPTLEAVPGRSPLGLAPERDGFLFVPRSYSPDSPAPLWIALHGAGGTSGTWRRYERAAESRGFVLLAVDSRGRTWDAMSGRFGADVPFLDRALSHTFARCRVDPRRVALMGFSDGASYALSLGCPNADLFSHLVAHSPGLLAQGYPQPRAIPIFVSHGRRDAVLPVENTRLWIVPTLRADGNDVTYREFDGTHELPDAVARAALDWFLD